MGPNSIAVTPRIDHRGAVPRDGGLFVGGDHQYVHVVNRYLDALLAVGVGRGVKTDTPPGQVEYARQATCQQLIGTGMTWPLVWATVPPKCCSIASSSRFEASCRNATSFGSGETRLNKSVCRFIIEPVMISNGVLPVGSTADFDIVTARCANCCSRKNFDKASSCSVVWLRSSSACSGTPSPRNARPHRAMALR
jgi:hypothetical protein